MVIGLQKDTFVQDMSIFLKHRFEQGKENYLIDKISPFSLFNVQSDGIISCKNPSCRIHVPPFHWKRYSY